MANRYDIQEAYFKYALDNGLSAITDRIESMGFQPVDTWEADEHYGFQSTLASMDYASGADYREILSAGGIEIYENITLKKVANTLARTIYRQQLEANCFNQCAQAEDYDHCGFSA